MKKLFLDDMRQPKDGVYLVDTNRRIYFEDDWVVVKNYQEFVDWITTNGMPEFISFDHDLADIHYEFVTGEIPYEGMNEKTGFHCAKWLVEYCLDNDVSLPLYQVHSANPVGKENIETYLGNAKKHLKI
jgi:hypothetical protein